MLGQFFIVGALTLPVLLFMLLCVYENLQKTGWRLIKEGRYVNAVFRSSGLLSVTTLYFDDGDTCPLRGEWNIEIPEGKNVRVYRNGLGESRIESV